MNGKIKSTDMKVNWYEDIIVIFVSSHKFYFTNIPLSLIQAALGCLPIQEFGLNQDTQVAMTYKFTTTFH